MEIKLGLFKLTFRDSKYYLTLGDKKKFEEFIKTDELEKAIQLLQSYWPKKSKQHDYLLSLEEELTSLRLSLNKYLDEELAIVHYYRSKRDSIVNTLLDEYRHISYRI